MPRPNLFPIILEIDQKIRFRFKTREGTRLSERANPENDAVGHFYPVASILQ